MREAGIGERRRQAQGERRGRERAGPMAAAMLALALMAAGARADPLDGATVTRPGEVLLVREARLAELRPLPPAERFALCGVEVEKWRTHEALTRLDSPEEYGSDLRAEPYAHTVMRAAAAGWGDDDAEARQALVDLLDRWARGRALTKFDRDNESNFYAVERSLLPTIVAWGLVRDSPDVDEADARRIAAWLKRVVRVRDRDTPISEIDDTWPNNHTYLTASVDMAWGALVGDDARFRNGIIAYRLAMGQLREDGSLPRETERGARALWYQRHAIASLVTIAEIAATQGYDLYGVAVDGRDIHLAIRFLLAAVEDPKLVWPYARANVNPGPFLNWRAQDLGFMVHRGHGRHYMAWAEPYMRRFPDRPETRRLGRMLRELDPEFRPMVDDYSGGDTTCFYKPPE
jgi:poly(beta-D-mannuronate) lyase